MLSVVVLSSLLISLGSAASCKSITFLGGAFIPIDYCYEVSFLGTSMSSKYACGGSTGVVKKEYSESGCNEANVQEEEAYQFDNPEIFYYDCDSSTLCDVTVLEAATCDTCTVANGCTKNHIFNLEFGFVTGQCISIPQIYLDAYNANRTAHGKEEITTVAIQFECDESVGIEPVAYDDTDCTQKSADQSAFEDIEDEAANADGEGELTIGCIPGPCDGGGNCSYVSLTCAANQIKILFAVFISTFISICL